jgi:amino acid adenylation domain-containing protein
MNSPLRDLPELSVEEKRALVAKLLRQRAAQAGHAAPADDLAQKRSLAARLIRERESQERRRPVHRMIEAQAARTPEALAVTGHGEALTYAELDEQSNRLAHHLRALGVGPDVLVGLCVERSTRMLVGLLGILKAGGAYVPLDPAFPSARLSHMVEDSRAPVLLTESHLVADLDDTPAQVVALDDDWYDIARRPAGPIEGDPEPAHLAYVIYTSGSSGKPKGVMVPHAGLTNFLRSMRRVLVITHDDVLLAVTTLSFDIAALELFLPLTCGARVAIASREEATDPARLARRLLRESATFLQATPATWRMLLDSGWEGDQALTMLCGGEAMPRELADRLLTKGRTLWNLYGPTETTIWSSAWEVKAGDGPISIGRPIDATQLYVLDARVRPVPVGLPGDLYIGGDGLARGYLNRPALTAEKFLPDPFSTTPGARIYQTGDLARWLPDGTIECLGRADHQVKVRGYRIEPGEVEAALVKQPSVRAAAVVARPDTTGELMLVAFVVPDQDGALDVTSLRQALKADLPDYMVPSAFVPLAELPLTPNGKVDRKALPSADGAMVAGAGGEYVAPQGPIETELAGLWAQLLRRDQVGANDDFFELGGHSLFAAQALARLRDAFGIEVSLRDFLEAPTVSGLARQIEHAQGAGTSRGLPPVVRVGREGDLALSYSQQAMWFLDQLAPGLPTFNIAAAAKVSGPLDLGVLERAFAELVDRHEVLRTTFVAKEGKPVQVIAPHVNVAIELIDLASLDEADRAAELDRLILRESRTPFDLTRAPLARALAVRLKPDEHAIVLSMHHIVTDGWSFGVAARELTDLYGAFLRGDPSPLAPLSVQFADYAAWQRDWLRGEVRERLAAHLRERLADVPALELPTDRPRPAVRTARGAQIALDVPRDVVECLQALGRREGTTLYMTLLAAFDVLMHRYSGQEDFAVGTPVANRPLPEIEGLIGYFVNVLALRADLSGRPTFRDLLARVRSIVLEAFEHQGLPLDQVVEAVQPPRDASRTPLFQVMFALQNNAVPEFSGAGLTLTPLELRDGSGTAKFDLTVGLAETAEGLSGTIEYDSDLFDRATIERLAGHFQTLLRSIVEGPERCIGELEWLTPAEKGQILGEWSGAGPAPEFAEPIHRVVARQAEATPLAAAIIADDRVWVYQELRLHANRVAHRLLGAGVKAGDRVALALPKSPELLAAVLGTLGAGGAYLPLDLDQPESRLAAILADADVRVLLAGEEVDISWAAGVPGIIRIDRELASFDDVPDTGSDVAVDPDQLAYVIYTSGSTGTPKGVMVPHRGLPQMLRAWTDAYGLRPGMPHLQMASPAFDVFAGDWVRALGTGGTLVLCPKEALLDPAALLALIEWNRVAAAEFVPSVAQALIEHVELHGSAGLRGLKLAVVGSDAWRAGQHERLRRLCAPDARVVNSYGLTEATIDSTYFDGATAGLAPADIVPIGQAFAGTRLYVLDEARAPVPVGVPGELHVGGPGVALGYVNRPELTAEKFVTDPFGPGRLYCTGDRCRWRADGQLEFLGRGDGQVKLRGLRIELGEIESALRGFPGVREAAVVVRQDDARGPRLDAYVVTAPDEALLLTGASLRRSLATRLPRPMVPASVTLLERMPLNASGKIDRKALPEPEVVASAEFVAPRTPSQRAVAEVWSSLLSRDEIGVEDDFFELGGHSLLAFQVVTELRRRLDVDLPVRLIFEAPTVASLAERIDALRWSSRGIALARRPEDLHREAPQSFGQEALWLFDQLQPGQSTYNVPFAVRVRGAVDAPALRQALMALVERHEILRTTFVNRDGRPLQVIHPDAPLPLEELDLSGLSRDERERLAAECVAEAAARPFDLVRGPLFRVVLVRLADDEHIAAFTLHHIICDGWSFSVAVRELGLLYDAFREGRPAPLPALPVQYADFALWQRQTLNGAEWDRLVAYWKNKLEGVGVLDLPTDRPRPARPSFRGGRGRFTIAPELTSRLMELGRRATATPFMTLLGAFQVLLWRLGGQHDFAVGVPVAGRDRPELEGLIGYFLNVLALRTDLEGDPTFLDLLARVRETTLGAFEHQALRAECVLEHLGARRDPLFRVMFTYQNFPIEHPALPGIEVGPMSDVQGSNAAKFDLTLFVVEAGGGLQATLEYDADLFEAATIDRMGRQLVRLLESIVDDPARPVSRLPLLGPDERRALLELGVSPMPAPASPVAAHLLFEEQVARTPGAVAVEYQGQTWTYAELNARANRLAYRLRALGVGGGSLVGTCLKKCPELVLGILGTLKAGAAYVPLDPVYPTERLANMLDDADVAVLLTEKELAPRFVGHGLGMIFLDEPEAFDDTWPDRDPLLDLRGDDLAYVLYTSGSTGRPKGVMVTHGGLVNYLAWAREAYEVREGGAVPVHSSISFDLTVTSLLVPLTAGARVELQPDSEGVEALTNLLRERSGYDLIKITPAHLLLLTEQLDPTAVAGLTRSFIVGGEQLTAESIAFWREHAPGTRIVNEYGPTETVVGCCVYTVPDDGDPRSGAVPIGRPIGATRLYVLDPSGALAPIGVAGELYIGGAGVARGYWKRPELTAEKFLADPFSDEPNARMYRTGDMVRWRADGHLEFLGRVDDQVKIRGYRVELGEIETVLAGHPEVREAAVVVHEMSGDRRLVAFLVAESGEEAPATPALRSWLRGRLPEYMVPSSFAFLEAVPLTPNGKVDRKALAKVVVSSEAPAVVGPRDEVEARLVAIWEETLQVRPIGVTDGFFEIGGHSLLAFRLLGRVEAEFGKGLPLAQLMAEPTVERMAHLLRGTDDVHIVSPLVRLQPRGELPPFFCAHPIGGLVYDYRELARRLGDGRPFLGLQATGFEGDAPPDATIWAMADRYLKAVREVQPHGPYYLGGWSLGTAIAFEMARKLRDEGETVAALVLIDGGPGYASAFRLLNMRLRRLSPERYRKEVFRIFGLDRLAEFESGPSWVDRLARIVRANMEAAAQYEPGRYDGPLTVVRAKGNAATWLAGASLGWKKYASGPIDTHEVAGDHYSVLKPPHLDPLVQIVRRALEASR